MVPSPEAHLPLNPRVFALLLALSEGPAHGYAMKQAAEERAQGSLRLDAGSLYRHLSRLVDDGLVEECEQPPETDADARRRYYQLTALGREVLAAEAARLEDLVELARSRRLLGGRSRA
ncbi:MAG TPA: PadR family transcriptional regulator [Thermoanaerobaculia bacterium]|nr:PadR family transcriptional regulator [Thermoanaerobaculia bacterium]